MRKIVRQSSPRSKRVEVSKPISTRSSCWVALFIAAIIAVLNHGYEIDDRFGLNQFLGRSPDMAEEPALLKVDSNKSKQSQ